LLSPHHFNDCLPYLLFLYFLLSFQLVIISTNNRAKKITGRNIAAKMSKVFMAKICKVTQRAIAIQTITTIIVAHIDNLEILGFCLSALLSVSLVFSSFSFPLPVQTLNTFANVDEVLPHYFNNCLS
jgi:ABC-type transport system involved in cytochrome bd biosynthesis fused ATPase/permease subunit